MSALVQFAAPATEPFTVAEAMQHCKLDASNSEPAPGSLTCALIAPAAAGNLSVGAYRYRVTFVTSSGETQAGEISAAVTVADNSVNGKVALSAIPIGGSLVTARKLYRTVAGGSSYLLLALLANNTATTYTDNIADASLGAEAPATNTTDDPGLTALIKAMRIAAEGMTRSAFVTQTWDMFLDQFPNWEMTIPKPPLQSVTSITYTDTNGVEQTLASDQYLVDTSTSPARITPAFGMIWPVTRWQTNAVKVRFVCGYGSAGAVPEGIKLWMKVRMMHYFDNPGAMSQIRGIVELPRSLIDGLLDDYAAPSFDWDHCS